MPLHSKAQVGLWSSAAELSYKPMSGPAWDAVKNAADQNFYPPVIENNNHPSNVYALAAGIVCARLVTEQGREPEAEMYKNRIIQVVEHLIADGIPDDCPNNPDDCNTLRWARNTGAFVLAADLVGYKTEEFNAWCRNMAEVWIASDGRTLLQMFKERASNWGAMAFGSLCAIYAYLQDTTRLNEIRDYWIKGIMGPNPCYTNYTKDLSWQFDPDDPRIINPKDAVKQGLIIDGVIPVDQRRSGSFQIPPNYTNYHWGHLQGLITAARILERVGLSIWAIGDSAIYRAAYHYQVSWEQEFGGFMARGDDEWLLPFLDDAYGTKWAQNQERLWEHGKIAGWPYVVEKSMVKIEDSNGNAIPFKFNLYQNYPNPFNSNTTFFNSLSQSEHVSLKVFNIKSEIVAILVDDILNVGLNKYHWNGIDFNGNAVSSGIYFCRLQAGSCVKKIKIILIR
ncbi:MAG TPA: T9SS type A sorting domain-containing protein [bacterium]